MEKSDSNNIYIDILRANRENCERNERPNGVRVYHVNFYEELLLLLFEKTRINSRIAQNDELLVTINNLYFNIIEPSRKLLKIEYFPILRRNTVYVYYGFHKVRSEAILFVLPV